MIYQKIIRPLLFNEDPEKVHHLAFKVGATLQQYDGFCKLLSDFTCFSDANYEIIRDGIRFKNPVGLAAGFDKNGILLPLYEALGFGYIEIGSITAEQTQGNPKPRLFRLPDDDAIINRMGLNNEGAMVICNRLKDRNTQIPVGVNIAKSPLKNLSGDNAIADYIRSFKLALPVADYITINISCPNTADGKSFEEPESFKKLIDSIRTEENSYSKPLYIKFSADTDDHSLKQLLHISESYDINGYVAINTSTSRQHLRTGWKKLDNIGSGGLSGKPLRERGLTIIKKIRDEIGGDKTIIGVGGILTPEDAYLRLEAGANLIQLYTGLIYNGPFLPYYINKKLANLS